MNEKFEQSISREIGVAALEAWKEGLAGHGLNTHYFNTISSDLVEKAVIAILAAHNAAVQVAEQAGYERGRQSVNHYSGKPSGQLPCDRCGSTFWTDWVLLPHELFNMVCPGGNAMLCFPCFKATKLQPPQTGGSDE